MRHISIILSPYYFHSYHDVVSTIHKDSAPAKVRKVDNDITTSSIFASITHSEDEADSSFECVAEEHGTEEPYMSQLRTPPKLIENIDESLADFLSHSEPQWNNDDPEISQCNKLAEVNNDDNEDESGGGSSAASTAADIMRDMLNELPHSNDNLGK